MRLEFEHFSLLWKYDDSHPNDEQNTSEQSNVIHWLMVPENTNDVTDQNDILNHNWCQVCILSDVNCKVKHHNGQCLNRTYVQERP